jgi:hypothetical protein
MTGLPRGNRQLTINLEWEGNDSRTDQGDCCRTSILGVAEESKG